MAGRTAARPPLGRPGVPPRARPFHPGRGRRAQPGGRRPLAALLGGTSRRHGAQGPPRPGDVGEDRRRSVRAAERPPPARAELAASSGPPAWRRDLGGARSGVPLLVHPPVALRAVVLGAADAVAPVRDHRFRPLAALTPTEVAPWSAVLTSAGLGLGRAGRRR